MDLIEDFFIIESLKIVDVEDGFIFYHALNTIKKVPVYVPVNNLKELKSALKKFENSNYRYLLFSSHGDEEHLELTDEKIHIDDLEDLKINFKERRIFMSTCRGGSFLFARFFIRRGVYSVVGSPDDLQQIVAISIWPTMMIVFDRLGSSLLTYSKINLAMKILINTFQITLHYYSFTRKKRLMKEYIYTYGTKRIRNDYPL